MGQARGMQPNSMVGRKILPSCVTRRVGRYDYRGCGRQVKGPDSAKTGDALARVEVHIWRAGRQASRQAGATAAPWAGGRGRKSRSSGSSSSGSSSSSKNSSKNRSRSRSSNQQPLEAAMATAAATAAAAAAATVVGAAVALVRRGERCALSEFSRGVGRERRPVSVPHQCHFFTKAELG